MAQCHDLLVTTRWRNVNAAVARSPQTTKVAGSGTDCSGKAIPEAKDNFRYFR